MSTLLIKPNYLRIYSTSFEEIVCHGFIFKSFAQNYRRAVAQEPLPNPKEVLRASISKRLCDSSALLKTFPQQEFSKCLTATGALAKPACRRIIYFFSIPLLCENKTNHKHSLLKSTFGFFCFKKCSYLCL